MLLAVEHQDAILNNLLRTGAQTQFGKDHYLKEVNDYQSFTQSVPLRDYEQLKSYIEEIKLGKPNILWKGKPIYFAKTSGTTSGVKYACKTLPLPS